MTCGYTALELHRDELLLVPSAEGGSTNAEAHEGRRSLSRTVAQAAELGRNTPSPCASQPHFRQLPGDAPGSQSTETLGETRGLTCPLRAAKQGAVTFLLLQGFLVIFSKIYSGAFYFSTLTRHCLPRVVEMSHLNTKSEHSQIQNVSIYTWKNYDLKRWEDRPGKNLESSCFIIF